MTMDTTAIPSLGTIMTADTVVGADADLFYLLDLAPNGSRRIELLTIRDGPSWVRDKDFLLDSHDELVAWGAITVVRVSDLPIGHYLPYPPADGVAIAAQEEPVNQYGYLPEWRGQVARFCHSFDALPGFESFNQLAAASKVTAFQVGQTIGGHAFERLAFWTTYDASLSDDWKLPIVFDPVKKAVDAVCFECQSETAARRLALTINHTQFAAKLAQGRIHGTDRSVNPWIPGVILTIVPATSEEVTVQSAISRLVSSYNSARDYYDVHVAHEPVPHDH